MNHDNRRVVTTGMRITQLHSPAINHRRSVVCDGILKNTSQHVGAEFTSRRLIRFMNRGVQITDSGAVPRRNKVNGRKIDERQAATDITLDLVLLFLLHSIPLVQRDDQCPPGVNHKPQQAKILINNPITRIHH